MATQISQVDLSRPLEPITLRRGYGALWILVRFGAQPLGWVKCSRTHVGSHLSVDAVGRMVAETLAMPVLDAARRRLFETREAPAERPSFSVVVCTREHPDLLARQLASMA